MKITMPLPMPEFETIDLQIGQWKIRPLPTGVFGLDGGAMFGTVPKVLWEKAIPADAQNRIPMEARALLLTSPTEQIVVDCGNGVDFVHKYGEKLGPKFAEMYGVKEEDGLIRALRGYGIAPESITRVILTHLHFDHCGGATRWDGSKLVPTFPNARYYIQKRNVAAAEQPNIRERASYFTSLFQPLRDHGVLDVLDGPVDGLLPGISLELSHGHTDGQQIVRVEDGDAALYYCADLIPTSSHVRLAWIMGYDLHPLLLIEEKRKLLTRAAERHAYLYFEHDPFFDATRIERVRDDFAVKSRYRIASPAISN